MGPAAFKAVGTGDPRPAGSIPVHLRRGPTTEGPAGVARVRAVKKVILLLALLGLLGLAARQLISS